MISTSIRRADYAPTMAYGSDVVGRSVANYDGIDDQPATTSVIQYKPSQSHGHVIPTCRTVNPSYSDGVDWVVQKFGGTSLGRFANTIVEDIVTYVGSGEHRLVVFTEDRSAGLRENRVALVCSARSTKTKTDGTTDRLLRATCDVLVADSVKYVQIVDALRTEHVAIGQESIHDKSLLEQYITDVGRECRILPKILESARFLRAVTDQTIDMVISVGEKLSCLFMTALLRTKGIGAVYVNLSEVIDVSSPIVLDDEFYRQLTCIIGATILNLGPTAVPIITGFFGQVPGGLLGQVGQGYTDLCAALVAVGLNARELQIWKEVDGIFTADPRKVSKARLLSTVSPAEARELTFYGSEVIHPFTMDQVLRANIPIRLKNVMNSRSAGTVIYPDSASFPSAKSTALFCSRKPSPAPSSRPKRPTAVTIKSHITVVNVHSNKRTRAHGFLASIFTILDLNGLSVDLISSSEVHISMAIHSQNVFAALEGEDKLRVQSEALQRAVDSLKAWGDVDLVSELAIISLVGRQLRSMVGISGRFFKALGDNGINIEMISQGASEISISCVIEERDAHRALCIVHETLFEGEDRVA